MIAGYILLVEPVESPGYGLAVFLRLWNLTCTEVPRPGVEITSRPAPTLRRACAGTPDRGPEAVTSCRSPPLTGFDAPHFYRLAIPRSGVNTKI
jgi:hypothetical protein